MSTTHEETKEPGSKRFYLDVDNKKMFADTLREAPCIMTDALGCYDKFLAEHNRSPNYPAIEAIALHYLRLLIESGEILTKSPMSTTTGIFAVTHFLSEQIFVKKRDEAWLREIIPNLNEGIGHLNLDGSMAVENALFWAKHWLQYSPHAQTMVENDIKSMLRIDTDPDVGLRLEDQREESVAA